MISIYDELIHLTMFEINISLAFSIIVGSSLLFDTISSVELQRIKRIIVSHEITLEGLCNRIYSIEDEDTLKKMHECQYVSETMEFYLLFLKCSQFIRREDFFPFDSNFDEKLSLREWCAIYTDDEDRKIRKLFQLITVTYREECPFEEQMEIVAKKIPDTWSFSDFFQCVDDVIRSPMSPTTKSTGLLELSTTY